MATAIGLYPPTKMLLLVVCFATRWHWNRKATHELSSMALRLWRQLLCDLLLLLFSLVARATLWLNV